MRFEQNVGHMDPRVHFLSRGRGYQVFLTESEAVLVLQDNPSRSSGPQGGFTNVERSSRVAEHSVLRLSLSGARPPTRISGSQALPTRVNYFRGRDASGWRQGVPTFARVEYEGVYPGVDLVYYGNQRRLEYDFIVAAGADPSLLKLEFQGATEVTLGDDGNLVLGAGKGEVVLHAPVVYQEVDGRRLLVDGAWRVDDAGRAGFSLGRYDETRPLVIDPVVEFATYLGGSGSEDGFDNMGVAVDASGHIYVAGTSDSADFPTTGEIQDQFAGITDAFVVKLDPTGSTTIYATYLGGGRLDSGQAVAVDGDGNAYVGGFTESSDFPTLTPLQGTIGGSFDGFVAKLDPSGSSLLYSTYIGGSARDFVLGIDVDDEGQAYLAGDVESENFPTVNPLQPVWGGVWDAWAAKLTASGDSLVFSTYLGGSFLDAGLDVKVDANGFVYVAGFTISSDFPTANPFQAVKAGDMDAYVLKLEPNGSDFVYSTYLGGETTDRAVGIDVDDFGNAYVVGDTLSTDFPSIRSIVAFAGFADAYIAKFDATGNVAYTTFVGGGVADHGLAIAADRSGNAHITGMTFSDTFLLVQPLQDEIAGNVDAFVASIDASGTRVTFSTFLGGGGGERGLAIAADAAGNIVVVGDTSSADFPMVKPIQSELDGLQDMFVARIGGGMDIVQDPALQIEQLVAGLLGPRAMVFIGADDLLVLEKRGWVRRVRGGVLDPEPVLEVSVDGTKDGRPYGLAAHPQFPATPLVYAYFTEVDLSNAPLGHRLYRYTWSGGKLESPELLLDIPIGPVSGAETGTIAFGPDGKLYLTSGDTGTMSELQNVVGGVSPDDTGVVMRLNQNGTAPTDNPFFSSGGNLRKYFAYGVASSAAFAFDPVGGRLWAADNGVTSFDEINLVPRGFNGGWSQLSGPAGPGSDESLELVEYPGSVYRDPVFSWRVPVVPSAMVFLDSGKVGDHYRNHLFVGSAIDGNLYHFKPNIQRDRLVFLGAGMVDRVADDHVEASESLFGVGFASISDLEIGPDGLLYVLSSARGGIFRVFWDSDIELRLSSSETAVTQGGTLPITLVLENKTNVRQDFAILLSIRLPRGVEFPVVGPMPLSLAPGARGTAELPVSLPPNAELGMWTFKGLIARPQAQEPDLVDLSAVDFDVLPGAQWIP